VYSPPEVDTYKMISEGRTRGNAFPREEKTVKEFTPKSSFPPTPVQYAVNRDLDIGRNTQGGSFGGAKRFGY